MHRRHWGVGSSRICLNTLMLIRHHHSSFVILLVMMRIYFILIGHDEEASKALTSPRIPNLDLLDLRSRDSAPAARRPCKDVVTTYLPIGHDDACLDCRRRTILYNTI